MSILETKRTTIETKQSANQIAVRQPLFGPKNFILMGVGVVLMILGYVLMVGGSSDANPEVFNAAEKYSTMRITIAPILILAGLAIQIPAILLRSK
ncbi:hypothetical protein BH09BAC1_BH09BAC1_28500 [soil metagenome]